VIIKNSKSWRKATISHISERHSSASSIKKVGRKTGVNCLPACQFKITTPSTFEWKVKIAGLFDFLTVALMGGINAVNITILTAFTYLSATVPRIPDWQNSTPNYQRYN
jgi:hypothetical protein